MMGEEIVIEQPTKIECPHDELVKGFLSYEGVRCAIINSEGQKLPEYVAYFPYTCKKCGEQYLVLQAVVQ